MPSARVTRAFQTAPEDLGEVEKTPLSARDKTMLDRSFSTRVFTRIRVVIERVFADLDPQNHVLIVESHRRSLARFEHPRHSNPTPEMFC